MEIPFKLPASVKLVEGRGGLPRFDVSTPLAQAQVYIHGAHVAHFQAEGQAPLLFISRKSYHETGRPIRGGVPIIFPWFGPHPTNPSAPAHGVARTRPWHPVSVEEKPDGTVELVFSLAPDEALQQEWGGGWALEYRISIGSRLTLDLLIRNTGSVPYSCEEALHTYFAVSDIRQVELLGLENTEYLSKIEDLPRKREGNAPIRFTGETDRIYVNTSGPYSIVDSGLRRTIHIEKSGSQSAIVWNPWIEKGKSMVDFDDNEWPDLLCVETGNVSENRLSIPAGAVHRSTTTLWAQALQTH